MAQTQETAPAVGNPVSGVPLASPTLAPALCETVTPSPFEDKVASSLNAGQTLDTCREEEPLNKFDGRMRRSSWIKTRSVDNISSLVPHE